MKVTLNRVNNAVHFEGIGNSSEVKVNIDGSPEIGGEGLGARPMELVLMALGSCSSLDLISILKKQRQEITNFSVDITGERREILPPVFTSIHMQINISGKLDEQKVEKAAELAIRKYCSVHDMLVAGGVNITYAIKLNS